MTDNFDITPGTGVTVRAIDKSSKKAQVVVLDLGGSGSESLLTTSLPVSNPALDFSVNLTVTNGTYTIGDVVGGLITITSAVSGNGKSLLIDSVTLSGQTSAIAYELWLLNADLATANVADNAVFTLAAADVSKFLGVIPISTLDQYQGQNAIFCASVAVGKKIKAGASTTSIYAYIKANATTSPGVTAMTFNINGRWVD